MIDPVALAQALIRRPSVTPADAGAQDVLANALAGLGFAIKRLRSGGPPDGPIDNLFATLGDGGPHFAFAGHSDVVPSGDGWAGDPFSGAIEDGVLHGRGAADMKGALAAMVAASAQWRAGGGAGRLSFLITGDEEGPATHGTADLLAWMAEHGHRPDACLVGEPTSATMLGDTLKIGRRGSLNAWLTVPGVQGHVAYPARADNPITRMVAILAELKARALDTGTDWFDASNLEVTDLAVGNPATNVIPAEARARLSVRFNDIHRGVDLARWLREVAARHAPGAQWTIRVSGEAFLTPPGPLSGLVAVASRAVTGRDPALSTSGGTSDARFIRAICPVVELGLVGATMHKVDERVPVADIHALTDIYAGVLDRFFSAAT